MGPLGLPPQPTPSGQTVRFQCCGCGQLLSIPAHLMGATGPCPVCGTLLATAAPAPPPPPFHIPSSFPEPPLQPQKRKRGTILADANIDYQHSERLQNLHTLKILGLAVLAFAFCLAIAWFMKDWSER